MIRITVAQTKLRNQAGTSKATGRAYDFNLQAIYLHTVDADGNPPPYPEKAEIILDKGQAPYAVGEYTAHPSSIYVDRNGSPALSLRLTPLPAKPAAAPAPRS